MRRGARAIRRRGAAARRCSRRRRAAGSVTVPPCAAASPRAIVRPSPVPPTSGGSVRRPVEGIEDAFALRLRDARAAVGDLEHEHRDPRAAPRARSRPRGRVLDRVLDEVAERAQRVHEVESPDEQRLPPARCDDAELACRPRSRRRAACTAPIRSSAVLSSMSSRSAPLVSFEKFEEVTDHAREAVGLLDDRARRARRPRRRRSSPMPCASALIVVSGVRRSCETAASSALLSRSASRSAAACSASAVSRRRSTPSAA